MKTIKVKPFRLRGHLWDEVREERNESMKQEGYVVIARPPCYSELKKHGYCVGAIDVKPEELPERVRKAWL